MTNFKKKIGITLRITNEKKYVEKRDSLSHDWSELLEKIGCIPIFIPNTITNKEEFLNEINVQGFILSGGDNINDNPERDSTEKAIIEFGIRNKIPLFGICRGMQVINKFFGGKLHVTNNSKHVNTDHQIDLTKDFPFCDKKSITVNSYHNNIIEIKDVGKNLKSFAIHQNDNTVEGFFHNELPITGVMWHPERNPDENSIQLFQRIFSLEN